MKLKKTFIILLTFSMLIRNVNYNVMYAITKDEQKQRIAELNAKEQLHYTAIVHTAYYYGEDAAYVYMVESVGNVTTDVVQLIVDCEIIGPEYIEGLRAAGYTNVDYSALEGNSGGTVSNPTPAPAPKTPTPFTVEPAHTHTYVEEITTEPTCIEEGVLTYVCDCGDSYTEAISVIEHQYESSVLKEAGCVEDGETGYTCSLCKDSYSEVIPAIGHVEGSLEVVTEAGCVTDGLKESCCTTCGEVLATEMISATGHTNGEWVVEKKSTMLQKGENVLRCSTCNEVLEVQEVPLAMMGWYVVGGIVVLIVVGVVVMGVKKKKQM